MDRTTGGANRERAVCAVAAAHVTEGAVSSIDDEVGGRIGGVADAANGAAVGQFGDFQNTAINGGSSRVVIGHMGQRQCAGTSLDERQAAAGVDCVVIGQDTREGGVGSISGRQRLGAVARIRDEASPADASEGLIEVVQVITCTGTHADWACRRNRVVNAVTKDTASDRDTGSAQVAGSTGEQESAVTGFGQGSPGGRAGDRATEGGRYGWAWDSDAAACGPQVHGTRERQVMASKHAAEGEVTIDGGGIADCAGRIVGEDCGAPGDGEGASADRTAGDGWHGPGAACTEDQAALAEGEARREGAGSRECQSTCARLGQRQHVGMLGDWDADGQASFGQPGVDEDHRIRAAELKGAQGCGRAADRRGR